jgi:hypothetical protein
LHFLKLSFPKIPSGHVLALDVAGFVEAFTLPQSVAQAHCAPSFFLLLFRREPIACLRLCLGLRCHRFGGGDCDPIKTPLRRNRLEKEIEIYLQRLAAYVSFHQLRTNPELH